VDRHWPPNETDTPSEVLLGAAAFELHAIGEKVRLGGLDSRDPWRQVSGWRQSGMKRRFTYVCDKHTYQVEVSPCAGGQWQMGVDGLVREVALERPEPDSVVLREGPRVFRFFALRDETGISISWRGAVYHVEYPKPGPGAATPTGASGTQTGLSAPMPGTVVKVAVRDGQQVREHEPLVVLEAMKMEHVIVAPRAGTVREVLFREGELVPAGAPVVVLE
jgi:3-methylcrotonyl-CoA carboxylase alpha subunit